MLSEKAADFILFKQIIELMVNKVHLTDKGLQQIINIRASMNLGLSIIKKKKNFLNLRLLIDQSLILQKFQIQIDLQDLLVVMDVFFYISQKEKLKLVKQ